MRTMLWTTLPPEAGAEQSMVRPHVERFDIRPEDVTLPLNIVRTSSRLRRKCHGSDWHAHVRALATWTGPQ